MTIHCKAVYENGSLRPEQPLALPEGARVEIAVDLLENAPAQCTIASRLTEIAALPLETDDRGFSGAEHNRILYGRGEA